MVKVGDIIRIVDMDGEPQYIGREGEVKHIDSMGQINGNGTCLWASEIEEFPIAVTKVRIGE